LSQMRATTSWVSPSMKRPGRDLSSPGSQTRRSSSWGTLTPSSVPVNVRPFGMLQAPGTPAIRYRCHSLPSAESPNRSAKATRSVSSAARRSARHGSVSGCPVSKSMYCPSVQSDASARLSPRATTVFSGVGGSADRAIPAESNESDSSATCAERNCAAKATGTRIPKTAARFEAMSDGIVSP